MPKASSSIVMVMVLVEVEGFWFVRSSMAAICGCRSATLSMATIGECRHARLFCIFDHPFCLAVAGKGGASSLHPQLWGLSD